MIATTPEKSRHLLELGLDPASADMEYCYIDEFNNGLQVKDAINAEVDNRLDRMFGVTHIPAWSLSALLNVMRKANAVTTLQVTSLSTLLRCKDMGFIWQNDLYIDDPTTAAYEMVCYLLRNNLITNN